MILGTKQNDAELMTLIPSIRNHMSEWQLVSVTLTRKSSLSTDDVVSKLLAAYKNFEGVVYPVSEHKVTCLVRLGVIHNYASVKSDLEAKLPEQSCRVLAKKMSATGLKQIQVDLMDKDDTGSMSMFKQREQRNKNILMVADDDMFVRKAMRKVLGFFGEVVEADTGDKVVSQYLNHNPDALLLDIHMPGQSGLDIIEKIMDIDPDAFILILSADSVRENVLQAMDKGAVGFLSKPPSKDKISHYLNQCITIR